MTAATKATAASTSAVEISTRCTVKNRVRAPAASVERSSAAMR
nr:hypothetical protein [Demequina litorisediminis]